ncbi:GTP cyclohydrolase 1 [Neltuma alba]|uniref:GTP cyclohydrolase 1 n=1 Tax=Neltuma alba TaxID=207710 RepID=UPI0010A346B7|nr:GTP cyclohydrolase 1 [Prosopis alba]XP_028795585.1 GTP cyclohydrolase 1 [Prosopis alba]XP_028795586.1 GTP cyclohydrolase 1 [Prosopis alba]
MGCLDEGHFNVEHDNVVSNGCVELGLEEEGNTSAIEDAVKVLLLGLGEDVNREGLRKTPLRVAKALREGTRGYRQKVKDIVQGALFPEAGLDNRVGHAGGAGGLVLVRDLDHFSYCEACLLPFQVKCHVGYISSGQRVVGLSKLSRVTDVFAKRLQEPQRLANEICTALHQEIKPAGVAVVIQCSHIHFPNIESVLLDSKHQGWVKILVSSGSGVFENKSADVWADFYNLLKFRGIDREEIQFRVSSDQCWCPSLSSLSAEASSKIEAVNPVTVAAVASILKSLGEDPLRKELAGTPGRFVKWLMNFQNCNMEMRLNGFLGNGMNSSDTNGNANLNDKQICSELNMPFWSQCEHHLLPFHGVVHIGYLGSDGFKPIGKSLLQSIVHFYGFKLQVQERLTRQIAETISPLLGGDVIVVVEASHTCMISRGIQKFGSSTATIAVLGNFLTDASARAMFLQSIPSSTSPEGL